MKKGLYIFLIIISTLGLLISGMTLIAITVNAVDIYFNGWQTSADYLYILFLIIGLPIFIISLLFFIISIIKFRKNKGRQ